MWAGSKDGRVGEWKEMKNTITDEEGMILPSSVQNDLGKFYKFYTDKRVIKRVLLGHYKH